MQKQVRGLAQENTVLKSKLAAAEKDKKRLEQTLIIIKNGDRDA